MLKTPQYQIQQAIVLEARKCTTGHACLADESYEMCGIRITTEKRARMVCEKQTSCPYNIRLGGKSVCTCPVRHAIYRKYGE